MKKPNIVFVFADEWRAQALGFAGDVNCRTPNIDRFAAQSMVFPNAVAGSPVCCPYRASLLTGQYPLTHGVFINDVELRPDCHSIARAFSAGGYDTAYIGKWHVYGSPDGAFGRRHAYVPRDYQMGFDYWKAFECTHDYNKSPYFFNDDPTPKMWEGYDAFPQSRDAAAYIKSHGASERPFMLMLSWGPPHFPLWTAPETYRKMYEGAEIVLRPNVPEHLREQAAKELRGYYAHIAALDDCFKIVHDAIEEAGIADDTLFVFTADHGDMRQSQGLETKHVPFEESVGVPFILRMPTDTGGRPSTCQVPMNAPDIMPTLLGLAGLPIPPSVEGVDWSATIRGEEALDPGAAALLSMPAEFTELLRNGMQAYRGLRTATHTYVRTREAPWLFFDNAADPYQMKNLVDDPSSRVLRDRLDKMLFERLAALKDEFLEGKTYLERAGLTHYREVKTPLTAVWQSPWGAKP